MTTMTTTMANLSEASNEDLIYAHTELNEKKLINYKESIILRKTIVKLEHNITDIDKDIKKIANEFLRRQEIENLNGIIDADTKKIDGFELLSEDELSIITKNMDKTDYRSWENPKRFNDLDRICEEVIVAKRRYPKWKLTNLCIGMQEECYPPRTLYNYQYTDEFGSIFN